MERKPGDAAVSPSTRTPVRPPPVAPVLVDERMRERRAAVAGIDARRRRRVRASATGVAGALALAAGLSLSPLFAIADIRVVGVVGERADDARTAAGILEGQSLLAADLGAATSRVEQLAWVDDAQVRRVPPSSLELVVLPRQPVAVIRLRDSSWVVDAEGRLLSGGTRDGLVTIEAPEVAVGPVGTQIDHVGVADALAVHLALPAPLRARVARYRVTESSEVILSLRAEGGATAQDVTPVRIGDSGRVDDKASAITLLLARLAAEGVDVTEVQLDVRAPDNPVVRPRP